MNLFHGIIALWLLAKAAASPVSNASGIFEFRCSVLSFNVTRYMHAAKTLRRGGFHVRRREPASTNDVHFVQRARNEFGPDFEHYPHGMMALSNRMSLEDMIHKFAQSNGAANEWHFFFEDDVAVHPEVDITSVRKLLHKGQELAQTVGFMYLGVCGPRWSKVQHGQNDALYRTCSGACTHAFGLTRARATTLVDEANNAMKGRQRWGEQLRIRAFLRKKRRLSTSRTAGVAGCIVLDRRMYFDQKLLALGERLGRPFLVVGANLTSPVDRDHVGIFYQDRAHFTTSIPS